MNRHSAKHRVTQLIAHNFIHIEDTDDYAPIGKNLKDTVDKLEEILLSVVDDVYDGIEEYYDYQ
jgi:hypothetical protein|tara:strand:+ start:103 stop:294 length:192 start_codon:yes stop_codon:yes gene_type:complete